jgi:hypothetical protein
MMTARSFPVSRTRKKQRDEAPKPRGYRALKPRCACGNKLAADRVARGMFQCPICEEAEQARDLIDHRRD